MIPFEGVSDAVLGPGAKILVTEPGAGDVAVVISGGVNNVGNVGDGVAATGATTGAVTGANTGANVGVTGGTSIGDGANTGGARLGDGAGTFLGGGAAKAGGGGCCFGGGAL